VCILADQLCDDVVDCPMGEDEDSGQCLFYKQTRDQLRQVGSSVQMLAELVMRHDRDRSDGDEL